MRKLIGALCMLIGLAMLGLAGFKLVWQHIDERNANESIAQISEAVREAIDAGANEYSYDYEKPDEDTIKPPIPTMTIDGREYIGYLEMPTIDRNLPVTSTWSTESLKYSPGLYYGESLESSIVIMAHSFPSHFGVLDSMEAGDPVQLIDADNCIHRYVVEKLEILEPHEIERMTESEYDLSLFTCTKSGQTRLTVRLKRVDSL